MKKIFTFVLALASFTGAYAAEYNLFPTADGWLWFDNQDSNARFVGLIDETPYKVMQGQEAKLVQMVYADQTPDYPPTVVDADIVGVGTDGETGSAGFRKGAIVLQPSSANSVPNGGGFVICLPSCSTLSIDYSCSSKVMARIVATTNPLADMNKVAASYDLSSADGWKVISAKYMSVFKRLPKGHQQWTGIEKLNNGSDATTIQSAKPIYIWFQSGTRDTIYIHGIKVTTPKQETTGITAPATNKAGIKTEVYSVNGQLLGNNKATSRLPKGVYIVKEGDKTRKVIKR
mgnify:FL=1